ncbi:hypothetical protein MHYP_G00056660 [Metynnis hypsauchen]
MPRNSPDWAGQQAQERPRLLKDTNRWEAAVAKGRRGQHMGTGAIEKAGCMRPCLGRIHKPGSEKDGQDAAGEGGSRPISSPVSDASFQAKSGKKSRKGPILLSNSGRYFACASSMVLLMVTTALRCLKTLTSYTGKCQESFESNKDLLVGNISYSFSFCHSISYNETTHLAVAGQMEPSQVFL